METFPAVIKLMSYNCVFKISVKRDYKIWRIDLLTAFLYRFLDKTIYVEQPIFLKLNSDFVCRLRKALYRLKQALQVWYQTLADFFEKIGLERFELDHRMLVTQDWLVFLAIYMDILLLISSNNSGLIDIQDKLNARFRMANLGKISHYLGMEVDVDVRKNISLRQTNYLKKVPERFKWQTTNLHLFLSTQI